MRAVRRDPEAEQPGSAGDDAFQLLMAVEIEPDRNAEAITQRRGQQPLPGGRADQGKGRQVDPYTRALGPSPMMRSSARSSIAG